uniref:DNA polymerase epsilon subunit 2 n=1 Tax=Canis lupus dingo TaxID=286419 RepID=A0A8C0LD00_CANLU
MAPERLRSRMVSAFKLRGLLLRGEAIKYLTEALESISEVELEDALEKIIDAVEKQPLSSNMIERSVVEAAVQECSQLVDETMYVDKMNFSPLLETLSFFLPSFFSFLFSFFFSSLLFSSLSFLSFLPFLPSSLPPSLPSFLDTQREAET